MKWKNFSGWLKGGIILFLIYLILLLISYLNQTPFGWFSLFFYLLIFPAVLIFIFIPWARFSLELIFRADSYIPLVLLVILNMALIFLIGALLGALIDFIAKKLS